MAAFGGENIGINNDAAGGATPRGVSVPGRTAAAGGQDGRAPARVSFLSPDRLSRLLQEARASEKSWNGDAESLRAHPVIAGGAKWIATGTPAQDASNWTAYFST
jgi:hypothetical protein